MTGRIRCSISFASGVRHHVSRRSRGGMWSIFAPALTNSHCAKVVYSYKLSRIVFCTFPQQANLTSAVPGQIRKHRVEFLEAQTKTPVELTAHAACHHEYVDYESPHAPTRLDPRQ
jgi:hypothetical protein